MTTPTPGVYTKRIGDLSWSPDAMMVATAASSSFARRHLWFYNNSLAGEYLGVLGWSIETQNPGGPARLSSFKGVDGAFVRNAVPLAFNRAEPPGQVYQDPAASAPPDTTFWFGGRGQQVQRNMFRVPKILIPPDWSLLADCSTLSLFLRVTIWFVVI